MTRVIGMVLGVVVLLLAFAGGAYAMFAASARPVLAESEVDSCDAVRSMQESANEHRAVYRVDRRVVSRDTAHPFCALIVHPVDVEHSGPNFSTDPFQVEFRVLDTRSQPFWGLREGDEFILVDLAPVLVHVVRKNGGVYLQRDPLQLMW
jgi:hypothetical protein